MNLYDFPKEKLSEEMYTKLFENKNVRVERIISTGNTTPEGFWYDQDEDEFVIMIDGIAKIAFENADEIALCTGDTLLIKAHQKHRVIYTRENPACVWLCIFINN